ncbi:hypothetical protein [Mycobacterium montefiorense]|nr:hypothetical protein [Mycobacterium montefiorense]
MDTLGRNEMAGSMTRFSTSSDNVAVKSFFGVLHKNLVDHHRWAIRE